MKKANKNCEGCGHLPDSKVSLRKQHPDREKINRPTGYCYMFDVYPGLCRLNTSLTPAQRLAVKRQQFCESYSNRTGRLFSELRFAFNLGGRRMGRTTVVNHLIQEQNCKQLTMDMNFMEIELLTMASFIKCHNKCPFIKLLLGKNETTQTK